MTVKSVLAMSALVLALAAPAAAQQAQGGKMFQRIDSNQDGQISREETQVVRDKRFDRMDLDGDGAISKAEFDTLGDRRFIKTDLNGDGFITPDEVSAARGMGGGQLQ